MLDWAACMHVHSFSCIEYYYSRMNCQDKMYLNGAGRDELLCWISMYSKKQNQQQSEWMPSKRLPGWWSLGLHVRVEERTLELVGIIQGFRQRQTLGWNCSYIPNALYALFSCCAPKYKIFSSLTLAANILSIKECIV